MFVDYYAILEINFNSSQETIKSAFRKQALKWHPDRNHEVDTTKRMQQINEAFFILKDLESHDRYKKEYKRYYESQNSKNFQRQDKQKDSKETKKSENYEDNSYEVFDEILNKWMSNARKQAIKLAKQTIEDIVGISKESGKAMGQAALYGFFKFIIFGIIMLIVLKTCQH